MAYVAQLLPDREQAEVILEALTEYVATRGNDYSNEKVLAAEGLKSKLITDMREFKSKLSTDMRRR
jgi:hypothetical protein